jgi:NAD(P)-dependent dehydrogenase (short-subunit alcohol dehydrogenase family)
MEQLKPVVEQVVAWMGVSSGIGRETTLRFAQRDAKVVVSARSETALSRGGDPGREQRGDVRGRRHFGV